MLAVSATACVPHTDGLRPDSDLVVISVVGTNDIHGQFGPAPHRGGISTLSGYVSALRDVRAKDGGVLLVDGGDTWQGTLASNLDEGALMVEAFNELGYAAAVIGNHEFDFGPVGSASIPASPADDARGNLKRRATEAGFPLLAANLIDENTGETVDWENVQPSAMVDVAGVKVGIVGVLTRSTLVTTIAANVGGLRIAPLGEAIVREATKLREAGAALVVVAAHAGGRCTDYTDPRDLASCDLTSEILAVAAGLPPGLVDHIVGGHEAHAIAHFVNGTAVTAGLAHGEAFGRVDFWVDRESGAVRGVLLHRPQPACPFQDADGSCVWSGDAMPATYEGRRVVPSPAIANIAARAAARAAAAENESLGVTLATPFTLQGSPESALGHLVTDILLDSIDADVVLLNVRGGLRSALPEGPLAYGSLFRMFPFDNSVVVLDLSGAELRTIVAAQAQDPHRRVGSAGLRVAVRCENDRLDVTMRLDDGRIIGDDDSVRVAVNDYLATGGDRILSPAMPAGGFDYVADPRLVRDVIADWFRQRGGTLNAADFAGSEGRWVLPDPLPANCAL
jgi:5'-nucleotidase